MSDILTLSQIKVPGTATSKDEAIREAGQILVDAGAVTPAYVDAMFDREKSISTYMGNFLAIPHGTNEAKDAISASALSVVRYDPPDRLGRQRGPVRGRHRRPEQRAPGDPGQDRGHLLGHGRGRQDDRGRIGQ